MPHQCTTCDRTFPDGSKAMLGGCPDCGGNKFQFLPGDALDDHQSIDQRSPTAPGDGPIGSEPSTPNQGERSSADNDILEAPSEPASGTPPTDAPEDAAQASARRSFVSQEELPSVDDPATVLEEVVRDSRTSKPDEDDRPDLETLRRELNDQFESIKILEPGQYELNLMELYDREEYIIALEEDGRYVIDVPARWTETPDE